MNFYFIRVISKHLKQHFFFLENRSKAKEDFNYGYYSSQITPYSLADSKQFIKIIFPAIRTLFQFIVIIYWFMI